MEGTLAGKIDIDKCQVCSCGSNLPAIYFCRKYPNPCNGQIIYCSECSSNEKTGHDHSTMLVNHKCFLLHTDFSQKKQKIDDQFQKATEQLVNYNPIIVWAEKGKKKLKSGAHYRD